MTYQSTFTFLIESRPVDSNQVIVINQARNTRSIDNQIKAVCCGMLYLSNRAVVITVPQSRESEGLVLSLFAKYL